MADAGWLHRPIGIEAGVGLPAAPEPSGVSRRRALAMAGGVAATAAGAVVHSGRSLIEDDDEFTSFQIAAELIKARERCVLFCYDDAIYPSVPLHPGEPVLGTATIGWGHTGVAAKPGAVITEAQAARLLERDMDWSADAVGEFEGELEHRGEPELGVHQRAALISLVFNIGEKNWRSAHTVRGRLLKGDRGGAADGLLNFVFTKGKRSAGLMRRREEERTLFLRDPIGDVDEEDEEGSPAVAESNVPPPGKSTTIWTEALGQVAIGMGAIETATGFSGRLQGIVLAGCLAVAVGAGVYKIWERLRKHRAGEIA